MERMLAGNEIAIEYIERLGSPKAATLESLVFISGPVQAFLKTSRYTHAAQDQIFMFTRRTSKWRICVAVDVKGQI